MNGKEIFFKVTVLLILILIVGIFIFTGGLALITKIFPTSGSPYDLQTSQTTQKTNQPAVVIPQPASPSAPLISPIAGGRARITKKTFGLYVTPQNSPVQPERFSGYHTGVDFETYPNEQTIDVPVVAACNGTLALKEWARGYGGVAVERCIVNGSPVTIIYGHVRETSITPSVGQKLTAGEKFAVLGTGYSHETDGERRHLHFGIHKGTSINILGYVQNKNDLQNWLDPAQYLP